MNLSLSIRYKVCNHFICNILHGLLAHGFHFNIKHTAMGMYFSNITKLSESPMSQNFGKKKTGMVAALSLLVALVLSPVGFDQAVAIQDYNNDELLQVESNSASVTDKTIRLTGGEPCFVPSHITINAGEKITFLNVDGTNGGIAHAIISVDGKTGIPDNTFDSGMLKIGDRFEVQFNESGVYYYIDSMHHPEMHGIIIVE